MLQQCNPFVQLFKHVKEIVTTQDVNLCFMAKTCKSTPVVPALVVVHDASRLIHMVEVITRHLVHCFILQGNGPLFDVGCVYIADAVDGRTYNTPSSDEVAAILPNIVDDAVSSLYDRTFVRDIVLNRRDNTMQTMDDCHPLSDSLTFPLLCPNGEKGWRPNTLRQR